MKPTRLAPVCKSSSLAQLVERPFFDLEVRRSSLAGVAFSPGRAQRAQLQQNEPNRPARPPAQASEGRALVRRPLSRPHLWVPSSVGRPEAH